MAWAAAVLAGGRSRRMQSRVAKVWQPLAGRPMAWHVVRALKEFGASPIVVVVGPGTSHLWASLGGGLTFAVQEEPRGTGHALSVALGALPAEATQVIAVNGDMPLVTAPTLGRLRRAHVSRGAVLSFLTAAVAQPEGLGRVRRDRRGRPVAIVEEREATPQEMAIREINAGAYCARLDWLREALPQLTPRGNGETYLTDLVALASQQGYRVATVSPSDPQEALGVNLRQHLAQAEAAMRYRINARMGDGGVTLRDMDSIYIDAGVEVGADTLIHPGVFLRGDTRIGAACVLGPHAVVSDGEVGDGCSVAGAVVEGYGLGAGVSVGPFSRLLAGGPRGVLPGVGPDGG